MSMPVESSTAVGKVSVAGATVTTPSYSTQDSPPSILFSGHAHDLTEPPSAPFPPGPVHSTASRLQPLSAPRPRSTLRGVAAPSDVARSFPPQGIPIPDPLHYFVRSSVDGRYMGRGTKTGEQRSMVVTDTVSGSTFTFDFGRYDPAFAKDFLYFQGGDENDKEICFVVPMKFFLEQSQASQVHQHYTLEWFKKNAPDTLIRIPGILVYQDLPVSGKFAVQSTGQVWDEGVQVPTDVDSIPNANSFAENESIVLTPLATPLSGFNIPAAKVGNVQLNDLGDRVVAQRVVGEETEAKPEFVVYEIVGEVAAGGPPPTLRELYKLPAAASKADMLGHDLLTFERRAGADRSEIVLHDMRSGKDTIVAAAKADRLYKFPHFVAAPNGGVEVRFVEQQWTKDASGKYDKAANVLKSVRLPTNP